MDYISEKRFPLDANDYKLYEEVGEGVSASVYRALCVPLNSGCSCVFSNLSWIVLFDF